MQRGRFHVLTMGCVLLSRRWRGITSTSQLEGNIQRKCSHSTLCLTCSVCCKLFCTVPGGGHPCRSAPCPCPDSHMRQLARDSSCRWGFSRLQVPSLKRHNHGVYSRGLLLRLKQSDTWTTRTSASLRKRDKM